MKRSSYRILMRHCLIMLPQILSAILLAVSHSPCLKIPTRPRVSTSGMMYPDVILMQDTYPKIVDFRLSGSAISPVKDQGACGSCWAFSAAESLESQYRLNGDVLNVSAQNFVDCAALDDGCGGGWMDDALAYAEKHGVETEKDYPYSGTTQNCTAAPAKERIKPSFYYELPKSDDALRHALVTIGPVSIAIDATANFEGYGPDDYILSDETCDPSVPNHALLLVGYNDVEHYWIIKNSWNTSWGREGYVYLNNTKKNVCGISGHATVPFVKPRTLNGFTHRVRSIDAAIPLAKGNDCVIKYLY